MPFALPWRERLTRRLTPVAVLVLALAATLVAGWYVQRTSRARDRARFEAEADAFEAQLNDHLSTYAAVLQATRGFIKTDAPPLTRAEFASFVGELQMAERFPGLQGIGYTVRVPREGLEAFVAFAKAQGHADFHVWPPVDGIDVHAILYLEPQDRRNAAALGYDMYSEATRRAAMDRAAATGEPALSGRVTLVQEIGEDIQSGFLLYVPIYRGAPTTPVERRDALVGFAYAPVRAGDFLRVLLGQGRLPGVEIAVVDETATGAPARLYATPGFDAAARARFRTTRGFDFAGHRWRLRYASGPSFDVGSNRDYWMLSLIAGALLSVLLFALVRSLYRAWAEAAATTDRLRASQAALAEIEARWRSLFGSSVAGVVVASLDGRIYDANQAFLDIVGRSREDLEGGRLDWVKMTSPDTAAVSRRSAETARRTGVMPPFEKAFVRPDGARVPALLGGVVVGEPGPEARILTLVIDLTDLEAARAALSIRDRRAAWRGSLLAEIAGAYVEARFDAQAIAVKVVDILTRDLCVVAAVFRRVGDEGGLALLGLRHVDPAIEAALRASPLGGEIDLDATGMGRVFRTQGPYFVPDVDFAAGRPPLPPGFDVAGDGPPIRSLLFLPLRAEERIVGVLGVGTVAPLNEDDYATLVEIADRTSLALENARLYQEARQAVRLRDEFLSIASHELKTPLTPLLLQMESLERLARRDTPVAPERLAGIAGVTIRQVQRLAALVQNLLDVSRISAGRLALEPERFDLAALIDETVERFALESERLGSAVTVEKKGDLTGTWDRLRLEQVVTNLLSNALKYGAGRPVEIAARRESDAVVLRVVDHGIGIDPAFLPQLFHRFARGVSGRSYGGLGLGLFIVQQIVSSHGGDVTARSGAGETVFEVRLPIDMDSARG